MLPVPTIAQAQEQWSPAGVYLNTASYGLPPRDGFDAMQQALEDWRGGRTSWEPWGESSEGARAAWAAMMGVTPNQVSIGATVSAFVGLIAASLPAGAHVIVPDVEFTSTLFPFLVQERRGVTVTTVAPDRLAEAIDARTDLVAFSAVQMSTGEVADLDAITAAARHHGARMVVDVTQAAGWLPLDTRRFDAVVCAGYKWLTCPRGTAFMAIDDAWLEDVVPHAAGWYAGAEVHSSYFGPPLRWPPTRAASTRRRRGSRGSARSRRSSCSTESASAPYTTTLSPSRTASAPASASSRPTAPSSPSRSRAAPRRSRGPGASPRCAADACARRGTSTTRTPTSTPRSRRSPTAPRWPDGAAACRPQSA